MMRYPLHPRVADVFFSNYSFPQFCVLLFGKAIANANTLLHINTHETFCLSAVLSVGDLCVCCAVLSYAVRTSLVCGFLRAGKCTFAAH